MYLVIRPLYYYYGAERERLTDDIALDRYRTLNEKGKEEK